MDGKLPSTTKDHTPAKRWSKMQEGLLGRDCGCRVQDCTERAYRTYEIGLMRVGLVLLKSIIDAYQYHHGDKSDFNNY